jgi:hypothetical protein
MSQCRLVGVILAVSSLALAAGCRTVGTAVGTAGRVASDTAQAAGKAAGSAASGAGEIVENTANEADREVRGK